MTRRRAEVHNIVVVVVAEERTVTMTRTLSIVDLPNDRYLAYRIFYYIGPV